MKKKRLEIKKFNYRIMASFCEISKEYRFAIHEIFYDENKNPITHSIDEIGPSGESISTIKEDLKRFKKAMKKPVLSLENFPKEHKPK